MQEKNRNSVITNMCLTFDHAYLLRVTKEERDASPFNMGYTAEEQQALWNQMAQIYDNDIAPIMKFKDDRL